MNDLNIYAGSTITGGEYGTIRVFGAANINGDLKANKIKVYGASVFNGQCDVNEMSINGACKFKGNVNVTQLTINGACDFNSNVHVDYFKIHGAANFKETVERVKEIIVYGAVSTTRLETDKIIVKGAIKCTEQLNADYIEIITKDKCTIHELVARKMVIRNKKNRFLLFKKFNRKSVRIDHIKGDFIELENVIANTVHGKTIKIGPNCKINKVVYKETLDVSKGSTIKDREQI